MKGQIFLIPTTLGEQNPFQVLSPQVIETIAATQYFIVENEKTARRFIKKVCPEKVISELTLFPLNKRIDFQEYKNYLNPIEEGFNIGIISEAGVPGVADPGAEIVALAHQKDIKVSPLVGPSSILLAIMASGLNGQSFAFNGYLPIDKNERKNAIKNLEQRAKQLNQTQLLMETPYRNMQLFQDFLSFCHPQTQLTIACDITLETEYIQTKTIENWKKQNLKLDKRPCIFALL